MRAPAAACKSIKKKGAEGAGQCELNNTPTRSDLTCSSYEATDEMKKFAGVGVMLERGKDPQYSTTGDV